MLLDAMFSPPMVPLVAVITPDDVTLKYVLFTTNVLLLKVTVPALMAIALVSFLNAFRTPDMSMVLAWSTPSTLRVIEALPPRLPDTLSEMLSASCSIFDFFSPDSSME